MLGDAIHVMRKYEKADMYQNSQDTNNLHANFICRDDTMIVKCRFVATMLCILPYGTICQQEEVPYQLKVKTTCVTMILMSILLTCFTVVFAASDTSSPGYYTISGVEYRNESEMNTNQYNAWA